MKEYKNDTLTFEEIRKANKTRCEKWHPEGINSWSSSDWITAITGELGELASLIKMRNRERDDLPGNKFSPTDKQIADETADVFMYLDLFAESLGIDLGKAIVSKFNEVSERVGFPDRIEVNERSTPGIARIARERQRQINSEGWDAAHDAQYSNNELECAARCYLDYTFSPSARVSIPVGWPWDEKWWKPSRDNVRNLEKAGALIAAAIDRTNSSNTETLEHNNLDDRVTELKQWVNDLQSGMYINCVYCGHRYGPDSEVPSTMADALKDHIEECPEHPMSQLKTENNELLDEIDSLICDLAQSMKNTVACEKALNDMRKSRDELYKKLETVRNERNGAGVKTRNELLPEMEKLVAENTELLKVLKMVYRFFTQEYYDINSPNVRDMWLEIVKTLADYDKGNIYE